jgi:hypothetical protein
MEQTDLFIEDTIKYICKEDSIPWMEPDELYYIEKQWKDEYGRCWRECLYSIEIHYYK